MIEGTKILVVDDFPEILEVLGEFLRLNGCEVYEAKTKSEAMKIIGNKDLDVILLDIKLPDANGVSMLREIKDLRPTVPVIMMTGYLEVDSVVDSMRKGASDFILKPIDFDKLVFSILRAKREKEILVEKMKVEELLDDKKKISLLNRELQEKIKEISTMFNISARLNTLKLNEDVFEKILEITHEVTDKKPCAYFFVDQTRKEIVPVKTKGEGEWKSIPVYESFLDEFTSARKHMAIGDLVLFPIVIKGECIGFIGVETKREKNGSIKQADILTLKTIVENSSVHIENRMLYESLFESIIQTLKTLVLAIDKRDAYTRGHCERVAEKCIRLGYVLGIPDYEMQALRIIGPLHDIGKVGIPDSILLKPEKLTEEEYKIMKSHSVHGEQIISNFEILAYEAKIVRHHHERYDGKGYPDGLMGDEIPLCSRILAVCDAYDAMVTTRPYRRALTKEEALSEIKRFKGTQFDTKVAEAFLDLQVSEGANRC